MKHKKMRMLGMVGGTSWHSSAEYYRHINLAVNQHFGDNTNPPLVLFNLNQSQVHQYQIDDNWTGVADLIMDGAVRLEKAGAESLIFCANTPHKVFETVQSSVGIPIIHIADATARAIQQQNIRKVCFIGTKFTMQEDFITGRIARHGIEVLVPEEPDVITELHRIIQKELTFGQIIEASKTYVLQTLQAMIDKGAESVILGCTEFPLMISDKDLVLPIFNTTEIHSNAATRYILNLED
ncbi:MAG: aspartate/glutamate racemase family protein [Roseivirga sp.]